MVMAVCSLVSIPFPATSSSPIPRRRLPRVGASPRPGGSPGDEREESLAILNAFYVGKALAETVNERVSSAVGEILSQLGRRQAEQQKRIREFQEDVEKRARNYVSESVTTKREEEEK